MKQRKKETSTQYLKEAKKKKERKGRERKNGDNKQTNRQKQTKEEINEEWMKTNNQTIKQNN